MIAGLPLHTGRFATVASSRTWRGSRFPVALGPAIKIERMAERVRFELTVLAYTRVPGVHLKPLGHLSEKAEKIVRYFVNVQARFGNIFFKTKDILACKTL